MADIKERIQQIISTEGLSQVRFAEQCGIKPAALNHVLKGRNRASFDLIDSILSAFPMYNKVWLTMGEGEMYVSGVRPQVTDVFVGRTPDPNTVDTPFAPTSSEQIHHGATYSDGNKLSSEVGFQYGFSNPHPEPSISSGDVRMNLPPVSPQSKAKKVSRIVVFYDDNTYETFVPAEHP